MSRARGSRLQVGMLVACAAVAALASAPGTRAQAVIPLPADRARAVERAVAAEMSRLNIPGLSIAVATGDDLRLTAAYGLADLENFVPAKPDTVFRLASLSKAITATAVMLLAERGLLDLDAPIQKYVPSFPEKPWPLTARQLLAHQAGIRHYAEGEMANPRHFASLTEALQLFKESPLLHEPGTKALYSSYGYNLLGCVIESASGMSFVEFVRQSILVPAGMTTTQADNHFEIIPNRAAGYFKDASGRLRNSPLSDTSSKVPAGGLCGTAADMGRFAAAFLSGSIVKPETVQKMLTRQKTRDGKLTGLGLGFVIGERGRRREAWCTGAAPKVSGTLYLRPDGRIAVVVLCNLESVPSPLMELARQVADITQR
jgi:serine beta-lactamase-like protein LACTB